VNDAQAATEAVREKMPQPPANKLAETQ
jgi:hypothetical protein